MAADIAIRHCSEQCIDDGMQGDIGITMAGKPFGMIEADTAEPEFLTFDEAVDVEAHADPNARLLNHEILREGQFSETFIALNMSHDATICTQDLRVITGTGFVLPGLMCTENCIKAKCLRGLYAPKPFTWSGAAHHAVVLD